jgi:hypothetical protein
MIITQGSTKSSILFIPVIVFLTIFALYTLTIPHNFSAAPDSIQLIYDIDRGDLFSPHHLLYNWLASYWVKGWRLLGVLSDSAQLVQMLNIIFGAMALSIFYLILNRRIGFNKFQALTGTALPAFSFGVWFYSSTIEVYIIPLFFLLLCFYLLTSSQYNITNIILIGITHGLALLFHQLNILFFPVVVFALARKNNNAIIAPIKRFFIYFSVIVPIVIIPYLLVMIIHYKIQSLSGMWYWLTYYGHLPGYWQTPGISVIFKAVVGFGHSLMGGHFILAIHPLANVLSKILGGKRLMDETFLVLHLNETIAYIFLGLFIIFILTIILGLILRARFFKAIWQTHRFNLTMLGIWLVSYTIFLLFWDTSNVEYWISQSVVWWFIFLIFWHKPRLSKPLDKSSFAIFVLAIILFSVNLFGSMWWLKDQNNDYYFVRTRHLTENTKHGDLAIIGSWWIMEHYLYRFSKVEVMAISNVIRESPYQEALNRINSAIKKTIDKKGKVVISGEAVNLEPETIEVGGKNISNFVEKLWLPYRNHWQMIPFDIDTVYVITNL